MVWFQDSILEHLHYHTFSNMLFNKISKAHCAKILWPKGGCLAYSSTNLPKLSTNFLNIFHNASNTTWTTSSFNCKYLLMRVHTSHWPYGYPPFTLCSWQRAHRNPWWSSQHLCCHCVGCWLPRGVKTSTCTSFKHIQLLPSTSQHCVHQRWHL